MKIIFAGTPENAALALELVSKNHEVVLVLTRPDAEIGRKRILTPSPVATKAQALGLPVLKANRIKSEELEQIKAAGAELALVEHPLQLATKVAGCISFAAVNSFWW
jgi:methionyl-tRNA formyltransferase